MKYPRVIAQAGYSSGISAAMRKGTLLAAMCFLMSFVCAAQTVEQAVDSGENSDQAVETSVQNTQPEFDQLSAEKLRKHVSYLRRTRGLKKRNYHFSSLRAKFIMRIITPVVIAYKEIDAEKREAKWRRENRKRNRPDTAPPPEPYEQGVNFHGWNNHAGDYSAVVMIQAMPIPKITGKQVLAGMLLGADAMLEMQEGAVHHSEFEARFDRMELYRAGEKIAHLTAERIPLASFETERTLKGIAQYGSYRYPVSAFAPGAALEVKVWEQGKSKPKIIRVKERVRRQVWSDFENVSSAKH